MRGRNWRRGRGLTLPEVLTAMVVLVVVGGTVVSIYQTSIRTWRTGMLENMAQQKASMAMQRMAPELHQGMTVVPGDAPFESSYIAVRLPNRPFNTTYQAHMNEVQVDALGMPYLVAGGWVVYFRGDAAGDPSLTGNCLWRRIVAADGSTVIRQSLVTDGVVDNPDDGSGAPKPIFVYWPDIFHLNSVEITITAEERLGPRYATSTMNSEIGLRNR